MLTCRYPIHRRVLRYCTFKFFIPSIAFAKAIVARLPIVPLRAVVNDAAVFTLCCNPPTCIHCLIDNALFIALQSKDYSVPWLLATGRLDSYPDWTFTSKHLETYLDAHSFTTVSTWSVTGNILSYNEVTPMCIATIKGYNLA